MRARLQLRQHDAATDETRDKYHASYKSEDAQIMMEAMDGISRAGALCTVVHNAQSSDWFQTWKPKCLAARGVIVIYSENYRSNFTMALQKEAEVTLLSPAFLHLPPNACLSVHTYILRLSLGDRLNV